MPKTAARKHYIIGGILVVVAAIGLYGILPQFGDFDSSLTILKQADLSFVALAAGASIASVMCSACIYKILSIRRIGYGNTLLVQLSGLLVNRVLPAGIGGLGLNYLYLRARKHSVAQATSIVTLNNALGFMGHILLAILLVLIAPTLFDDIQLPFGLLIGVGALLVVLPTFLLLLWRGHIPRLKAWKTVLRYYVNRPQRLIAAIGVSFLLTLSNVMALWLCCIALDVQISFFAVFIVFTFGITIGTVTPTPGGLGGVEAALVGSLIVHDVAAAPALAVALLYRLTSYWFGLLVGASASVIVQRRHLLRR